MPVSQAPWTRFFFDYPSAGRRESDVMLVHLFAVGVRFSTGDAQPHVVSNKGRADGQPGCGLQNWLEGGAPPTLKKDAGGCVHFLPLGKIGITGAPLVKSNNRT